MIKRLLLVLLASAASASAQTTAFGTKATANATAPADSAATAPATKGASKAVEEEVDDSVVITPFRSLTPPEAKTSRTFQLSKVNKLGFTETTKELQRLYSAFATQRIIDGPNEALAAGADTMAVLLLDKPAKVGDTGKITGMHVGTVALRFTANYAPLTGKRFTLRREAFVECATLEDSPAGLQKFVEAVIAGAEMSATTNEQIPCKKCGGVGFTREAQKGQLLDKRVPCADCVSSGKVIISVETKFIP